MEQTKMAYNSTPKKYGRTLLLKPVDGYEITTTDFSSLTGTVSNTKTKLTNSYFLTFDTADNAKLAFEYVKNSLPNVLVKYSYYRVFFTVSGLTNESNYDTVKQQFINYIETTTQSCVLFFKLYKKNGEYIGCGDFTLDTLSGMSCLLNHENGKKLFSFADGLTGSFHKYNSHKTKPSTNYV